MISNKATVISGSKAYGEDNIQSFLSPVHYNQDICIYNLLLSTQVSSSMTKASISLEAKKKIIYFFFIRTLLNNRYAFLDENKTNHTVQQDQPSRTTSFFTPINIHHLLRYIASALTLSCYFRLNP